MRMLLKVSIPNNGGNEAIQSGELPKIFGTWMEANKPEAAYFVALKGCRTALIFFDMNETVDIPTLCEPFMHGLNASIELTPAMDAKDMQEGVKQSQGAS